MFKRVEAKVNLVEMEERILKFWKDARVFEKSLQKNKHNKKFVFYEGPPTANGAPGVHHVLSRVFKDIFPRYKTMKGYYVPRKAGWDTHGLPVELEIEKKLNINSKKEIEEIGIEKFNRLCKQSVMRYEEEWKKMTERIGFWIDMDNAYYTFTNDYIETIWWILKTVWDKDLLYQGHKIVPYCTRCGTALSSHEIALGYKEVIDKTIVVKFKLKEKKNCYLLVWTTTPWTLVSNVGCAINPKATYAEVEFEDQCLVLAGDLVESVFGEEDSYRVIRKFSGKELVGKKYEPIYDYAEDSTRAYKVVPGDFVSTREGTGIVHIAPAFGEDDMSVGLKNNLPVVQMVDYDGKFKPEVDQFAKMGIEESNPVIIDDLKKRNLLFSFENHKHSYPFCWRCDSRLIYYAKKSWYIRTSKIKQQLLDSNQKVNWYPEHIKYGRFGKWLENNIDWALTRERYWGTPLPIWEDENGHRVCIGSIQELKQMAVEEFDELDLHRPYVDNVKVKCPQCGQHMHRVTEVIDVWFDSGSMPFAQFHYPFENQELFKESFPADFICEAIDQTRGWFYTMLAISTFLFKQSSYKNVLCLGLINDENGQKMSKSRGNIVEPWKILNKQGADALRWYFFTAVSPWLPKNFSVSSVDEVIRKFILTLWNTYSFFVIYANIDNFDPAKHHLKVEDRQEIDRWIISELNKTVKEVNRLLDDYNVTDSGRLIQDFVDNLSNWYVRRSRRRFWKSGTDKEKISAYKTLYECLTTVALLCAPYVPFISEEIYQNLVVGMDQDKVSVHLQDYPEDDMELIDEQLSFNMEIARKVVGLGRTIRNKLNIKTRQPLSEVIIYFDVDKKVTEAIRHFEPIIKEELNVKQVNILDDRGQLVSYDIKPNLKLLGSKYGAMVPKIKQSLEEMNPAMVALKSESSKKISMMVDGKHIDLEPDEVLVDIVNKEGLGIESDGTFTIGLPSEIEPGLLEEGFARELVHQIQNLRKEADFKIENTINTYIDCGPEEKKIIKKYDDYIKKETLTQKLNFGKKEECFNREAEVDGSSMTIAIVVVGSIV
ncbi:MAG: isoleucine--tRNA ligase [Actinomycetia bacterium]|nr:isoleucine--tRNA ligase [Actinomycetes bacterium]